MSTRCNIILQDDNAAKRIYLYHHHDGYPEGVGSDLAHYIAEWNKLYFYAIEEYANRLIKGEQSPFYEKVDDEYRLTRGLHGDIEFLYILHFAFDAETGRNTLTLEAYRVLWNDDIPEDNTTPCFYTIVDDRKVQPITL